MCLVRLFGGTQCILLTCSEVRSWAGMSALSIGFYSGIYSCQSGKDCGENYLLLGINPSASAEVQPVRTELFFSNFI